MVLKLYGSPSSGAVRLVAFILREKEVPFELIPIDFSKKEQKSPEYLEKQPFGQVPCIVCGVVWLYSKCSAIHSPWLFFLQDDDGFILYESRAICYYIAAKYPNQGTPLLPTELKANALFHQAASVEIYHFSDNILKAAEEMLFKPWAFPLGPWDWMSNGWRIFSPRMRGLQPDNEAFEKHIAALALKLDVYEKILSKQKYIAGDVCVLNYVKMNIHLCTFHFVRKSH